MMYSAESSSSSSVAAMPRLSRTGLFTLPSSPRKLIGRTDAVDFLDSGENLEIARIEIDARAHGGQNGLPLTGGAMNREPHPNEVFHHVLDLLLGSRILHGNNHGKLTKC